MSGTKEQDKLEQTTKAMFGLGEVPDKQSPEPSEDDLRRKSSLSEDGEIEEIDPENG